jgi:hypothetical protein
VRNLITLGSLEKFIDSLTKYVNNNPRYQHCNS